MPVIRYLAEVLPTIEPAAVEPPGARGPLRHFSDNATLRPLNAHSPSRRRRGVALPVSLRRPARAPACVSNGFLW
jgi:hypothetical protein